MLKRTLLAVISVCAASAAFAQAAPAAGAWSVEAVNAADAAPTVGANAKGAAVLRAQILLDRARFSSGELDGAYGSNLRLAIAGYQKKQGINVSGTVDAATWTALNADAAAVLITYTLQESDVAGPFAAVPVNMAEQAKLTALGYASAEEALAEKFHASPALLKRLNPGRDFSRAGEQIVVPNVLDIAPLSQAKKIVVDRSDGTLTLLDAEGVVLAQYPATTGSSRDPLPVGEWKVDSVLMNPVFHYNPKLFWDAKADEKAAKIAPGPNNPVGVAWIDLSKPHYGIHGTPSPSTIGKTQSHGCIRLTNWDVTAVAKAVSAGAQVLLQE
ncbi:MULTISPECIES: L,D-transpeptidase family protein [unclassified Janthinobacterium]|uniref:L,D-transpeptidase family protein n=1 Tax=unclassified Janthinobacterium TaxID=2610881 RepID=UPI00034982A9|nr:MULTISPECIES: L,D-transpeptidase [unclassified Janthinobacterium]MEC5160532.1 lipoprotein-anchoring transpeptidase ErfK/SrfK [Janthinobacterium sp. CG_S6]